MTFERMMNRTILGKFISRKSNDKVYFTKTNTPPQMMQIAPNAKKRHIFRLFWFVFSSFPKIRIFLDI